MGSKLLTHLVGLAVVVAAFVAVSVTHAGKKASSSKTMFVNGDLVDCHTVNESRHDGDNQLNMVAIAGKFTGTLNGSYDGTERNVVHKDGSASFSGSGVFTGEVNGRSGTAVLTYAGTVDTKRAVIAHWVLDKGTDDLARLDGQGTFQGKELRQALEGCKDSKSQTAFSGNYRGIVQFPGQ